MPSLRSHGPSAATSEAAVALATSASVVQQHLKLLLFQLSEFLVYMPTDLRFDFAAEDMRFAFWSFMKHAMTRTIVFFRSDGWKGHGTHVIILPLHFALFF